MIVKAIVQKS